MNLVTKMPCNIILIIMINTFAYFHSPMGLGCWYSYEVTTITPHLRPRFLSILQLETNYHQGHVITMKITISEPTNYKILYMYDSNC